MGYQIIQLLYLNASYSDKDHVTEPKSSDLPVK